MPRQQHQQQQPAWELPPHNSGALDLAKQILSLNAPRWFGNTSCGNFICCHACNSTQCEPSCPEFEAYQQLQCLYEYCVLHEQQDSATEAARARAVSSRIVPQKLQDVEECRQLFGLVR